MRKCKCRKASFLLSMSRRLTGSRPDRQQSRHDRLPRPVRARSAASRVSRSGMSARPGRHRPVRRHRDVLLYDDPHYLGSTRPGRRLPLRDEDNRRTRRTPLPPCAVAEPPSCCPATAATSTTGCSKSIGWSTLPLSPARAPSGLNASKHSEATATSRRPANLRVPRVDAGEVGQKPIVPGHRGQQYVGPATAGNSFRAGFEGAGPTRWPSPRRLASRGSPA